MTTSKKISDALTKLGYLYVGLVEQNVETFCCKHINEFYIFVYPNGMVRFGRDLKSSMRVGKTNIDAILSEVRCREVV